MIHIDTREITLTVSIMMQKTIMKTGAVNFSANEKSILIKRIY